MKYLPPPCKGGCGRPVRPRGTTAEDYPTTRTWYIKARGMCDRCYKSTEGRTRKLRPENCTGCHRPLRGGKQTLKDCPGTVRHWGKGICDTCKKGAKSQKKASPTSCVMCEHPLRPRGRTVEEFPGTKQHECNGLCPACRAAVRRGTAKLTPASTAQSASAPGGTLKRRGRAEVVPEITDPGLLKMRRDRQERARRQEQFHRVRVAQEAARAQFIQSRRAA